MPLNKQNILCQAITKKVIEAANTGMEMADTTPIQSKWDTTLDDLMDDPECQEV